MTKNPYTKSPGPPQMLMSYVCFADILGYAQLSKEAITTGKGPEFLEHLRSALWSSYRLVRKKSEVGRGNDAVYALKVFTDNIVVGCPLSLRLNQGEPELGIILGLFAEFQAGLAMEGFFLRGGIAYGEHYMDDDIVFGDALLQAVELDKSGGPPRLALAPSTVEVVQKHLGYYDRVHHAPHYHHLLEDADGTIFLNYLEEAFFAFPEGGVFFEVVEGHQKAVIQELEKYKGNPGVRAKYEWTARYHNFVCRDFVENHPVPYGPDGDEIYALACEDAQKLLDYLIDVESFAAAPSRISFPISPSKP